MSTVAAMLTPEMRKLLHRAGEKVTMATKERNHLIFRAVADGGSLREIGEAVGLSHQAVKLICEREAKG